MGERVESISVYKGHPLEEKVRELTRNDFAPLAVAQLKLLAHATSSQTNCAQIAETLKERLAVGPSSWRVVLKALLVVDYLLHVGSNQMVASLKLKNIDVINACTNFPTSKDRQSGHKTSFLRKKASELVHLLSHGQVLVWARRGAAKALGLLIGEEAESMDFSFDADPEEATISSLDGLVLRVMSQEETAAKIVRNAAVDELRTYFASLDVSSHVSLLSPKPYKSSCLSDIYQGVLTMGGSSTKVALKTIRFSPASHETIMKRLVREISVWHEVKHVNILPLRGLHWDLCEMPVLVSPWYENGDINCFIKSRPPSADIDGLKIELFEQIVCGLDYLHSYTPAIVHGDVKGANVLVSDTGVARLCDFGLATVLSENSRSFATHPTTSGTFRWMAPELFAEDSAPHTTQTDMWAFGCLLIEVQSGFVPYHTVDSDQGVIRALFLRETPARPSNVPDRLWWLALQLWSFEAVERPPASVVLERTQRLHRSYKQNPRAWRQPDVPSDPTQLPPVVAYRHLGPNIPKILTADLLQGQFWLQALHVLLNSGRAIMRKHFEHVPEDLTALLRLCIDGAQTPSRTSPILLQRVACAVIEYFDWFLTDQEGDGASHASLLENAILAVATPSHEIRPLVRLLDRSSSTYARWVLKWLSSPLRCPPLRGHAGPVSCIAYVPNGGTLVSGSEDSTICLWDVPTGACVSGPLRGHSRPISCLATSSNGRYVVSGCLSGMVRVWDAFTGADILGPLLHHTYACIAVALSSDGGYLASADVDGVVCVWKVEGTCAVPIREIRCDGDITLLEFSPEAGSRSMTVFVRAGHTSTVHIWDAFDGSNIPQTASHPDGPSAIRLDVLSRDQQRAATAFFGGLLRIARAATGEVEKEFKTRHTQPIADLAFSPCGEQVASGSHDGTIRVWDIRSNETVSRMISVRSPVNAVAYAPDGKSVASGSSDGIVRIWDVTDEWKQDHWEAEGGGGPEAAELS